MRFLVLSDVHGNLEALRAVMRAAAEPGFDRLLVLGDVVGYGADPNAVVETIRSVADCDGVRGNHDRVACGAGEAEGFNEAARLAAHWTRRALTPENRDWLKALPQGPVAFAPGRLLCHGTPLDEDEYLLDDGEARRCFEGRAFDLCFFGHSHYPGAFLLENGRVARRPAAGDGTRLAIRPGVRHLVNPGSVGQPRDRDPRAGFALYDDAAGDVLFRRVEYATAEARDKILRAGLPRWLGERLLLGA